MKAGTRRRIWIVGLSLAAMAIMVCVTLFFLKNNPAAWRKAYADKITHKVPLGSPQQEFRNAVHAGLLGEYSPSRGDDCVEWEPVKNGVFSFEIYAEPIVDGKDGGISGYTITSVMRLFKRGSFFDYSAVYE